MELDEYEAQGLIDSFTETVNLGTLALIEDIIREYNTTASDKLHKIRALILSE